VPRTTAAHQQQIRERIVQAAVRVFAERGFHRATIQDVVRESGLSVGAIYTYFGSKDELFLATCDMSAGHALGELGRRLAGGGSSAEKLAIAVAFFLDSVVDSTDPAARFLVQAWAEADNEPAVREMLLRRRTQLSVAARLLLDEGIARGELPSWIDAEALGDAATALLDGLVLARLEEGPAYRRAVHERRARSIVELMLAAGSSPVRPALPAVPARPFGMLPVRDPTARAS
jgi:AcrR family transcriptional regulator